MDTDILLSKEQAYLTVKASRLMREAEGYDILLHGCRIPYLRTMLEQKIQLALMYLRESQSQLVMLSLLDIDLTAIDVTSTTEGPTL